MRTAIVLGATGLTGKLLVSQLIADESYSRIKLFTRRKSDFNSSKIDKFVGDVIDLDRFKSDFNADVVFCCIGTTAAKTKDRAVYKQIDFGIPVKAAALCKENGIDTFVVVSAMGADSQSGIFYNRTKGEMEQAVLASGVKNCYILRPSLIKGNRDEKRLGETIASGIMSVANVFMVGKWRKYRAIEAKTIALGMIHVAKDGYSENIIESDKIELL
ncbi:MAG: NAD(P)H-binding protein [Breznakibacter sp.]|nr:NAD(P)H-binding protein [Breznakibacter sp.]